MKERKMRKTGHMPMDVHMTKRAVKDKIFKMLVDNFFPAVDHTPSPYPFLYR